MAFVPIGTTDGSDYHGKLREVYIPAGIGSDVFLGDMMTLAATGAPANGRGEPLAFPTNEATQQNVIGAVVEFVPDFTDEGSLTRNFHQNGTAQFARVPFGNKVIYEAPARDAIPIADIGSNRTVQTTDVSGDTVTGISGHGIGPTATVATDPLRILGASYTENDDATAVTAVGAIWRCRIINGADRDGASI
ncbi:MAG: hypothetical protein ACR2PR_08715 [Pseudohongiellaceae bacterium]